MKLFVFGETGQVATELQRRAPGGWSVTAVGREAADLSCPDDCARLVAQVDADAVINAAAYTAVDKAEEDEAQAALVNGKAPAAMAQAAAKRALPFLHISTDYVFDGSGTAAWQPTDMTGPLSAYGRTKLMGEDGVRSANGPHAILRTSWVVSAHGNNFVKTMLRLSETYDRLTIVADQTGGPTPAAAIADALFGMAEHLTHTPDLSGTYHFSGASDTNWADFAREIFAQSGRNTTVEDIPTSAYPTPAHRPANSRLNCDSLTEAFGIERPGWRTHLTKILQELGALA